MTFCNYDDDQDLFLANSDEGEIKDEKGLRIYWFFFFICEAEDVGYIRMDCQPSLELVGQLGGKTGNKVHVSVVKYNIYLDAAEITCFI